MKALDAVLFVSNADDPSAVVRALELDGVDVTLVIDPSAAVEHLAVSAPSLVLVDLSSGGVNGLRGCRMLAEASSAPVVVWADSLTDNERIAGLMLGVSEILPAGLSVDEVAARIRQRLREQIAIRQARQRPHQVGDLVLEPARRRVLVHGRPIKTTRLEFEILSALVARRGEVWPRKDLLTTVWGPGWVGAPNVLDTHIANLRSKLAKSDAQTRIATVWGVGYCLDDESFAAVG